MEWTTKRFSLLTGVSIRTLHYYDEIGLLKPFTVNEQSGYRCYNEESFSTMKRILFYRELGFPLESIRAVMSASDENRRMALAERKQELMRENERLERLVALLDRIEQGEDVQKIISSFDKNTAMLDERTTSFYEILDEADRLLENDTVNEQLVLVKTAKGSIHHFFNDPMTNYDWDKDRNFLNMLRQKEEAEIRYVVVLWNPRAVPVLQPDIPYALDVPNWRLSKGILELAPGNEEALIFLLGEGVYNARTLKSIQPPKKQV